MSQATGIEWTDATWNPIRGCSRVSEGCRHCYAETTANRFRGPGQPYEGLLQISKPQWNGQIRFVEEHLLDPLRWKPILGGFRPRRIFVNSMSDLFHENVTDEMLDRIFAVMALCPQHTFQVLTKRPERMLAYLTADEVYARWAMNGGAFAVERVIPLEKYADRASFRDTRGVFRSVFSRWPLPNVWLGVSVENQKAADERIPLLLQTPAAVRFLSAEPLLGSVDLTNLNAAALDRATRIGGGDPLDEGWSYTCLHTGDMYHGGPGDVSDGPLRSTALDWVICGGESGPGARPMHPDWARSLRDQCKAAGVPFFFKQWGEWAPGAQGADYSRKGAAFTRMDIAGYPSNDPTKWLASDALFYRVGKKAAGHLLDGEVIQQFPEGIACSGGKSA